MSPLSASRARARFRLAFFLLPFVAVALVAGAYSATTADFGSPPHPTPDPKIPAGAWGHVAHYRNFTVLTLGPVADPRRRYEHGSARISFTSASLEVSNDGGKSFHPLDGEPMGVCGYHWQGFGVNAIVALKDCVPSGVKDPSGAPAHEWIRVENLVPQARFVVLRTSGEPEAKLNLGS